MKRINAVFWGATFALLAVAAVAVGVGFVDANVAGNALTGALTAEFALAADLKTLEAAMKKAFDAMGVTMREKEEALLKAIRENETLNRIEASTAKQLNELGAKGNAAAAEVLEIRKQLLDLAQKAGTVPQGGGEKVVSLYSMIVESDPWKEASKRVGAKSMDPVVIGSFHRFGMSGFRNAPVLNPNPLTNDQPLTPAQRVPGLIVPPEQRLYIRDLIPQATTDSNLIEFARELSFTNAAAPQGGTSPTGHGEGSEKAESAMTFELANAPVITLAHWIPASRQILSDAKMLQGHISGRLLYGLKLEEEEELLTGDGGAGKLRGLNAAATAYDRGSSNDTALDTLLKLQLQVSLSNFELSAYIMHPVDWFACMLLKDTTNRYLFSDPQSMVQPRAWAKPVVASQTQVIGQVTGGAFNLAAQIWDREDATVRVSENVNDHFIRNMVAILAEERLALTIYRDSAIVKGTLGSAN